MSLAKARVLALMLLTGIVVLGCREPLDFDHAYTADDARGRALIKQNCANSCHPSDAFTRPNRKAKNYSQLAYTVRDYYEQVVGAESDYSQQDIFDMARYLNRNYYHFRSSY